MDKKTIATFVAIVGVVGAGAFYGGVKYGMNKNVSGVDRSQIAGRQGGMQNDQGGQNQRMAGSGKQGSGAADGGFSGGEIISKDDKSVTIKTKDGGSKIVYFSDTTSIGKETSGTASDLSVGQQVMISGKANTDGSIAAQNIQIRSAQEQQAPLQ